MSRPTHFPTEPNIGIKRRCIVCLVLIIACHDPCIEALLGGQTEKKIHFSFIQFDPPIQALRRQNSTFMNSVLDEDFFIIKKNSGFLARELFVPTRELGHDSLNTNEEITIPLEIYNKLQDIYVIDFHPSDTTITNHDISPALYSSDIYPVIHRIEYERLYIHKPEDTLEKTVPYDSIHSDNMLEELKNRRQKYNDMKDFLSSDPKSYHRLFEYEQALWKLFKLYRKYYSKYNTRFPNILTAIEGGNLPDHSLDTRLFTRNSHYFLNHWKSDSLFEPSEFPGWIWNGRNSLLEPSNKKYVPIKLFEYCIPVYEQFNSSLQMEYLIGYNEYTAIQLYAEDRENINNIHPDSLRVAVLFPKFGRVEDNKIKFNLKKWFQVFNLRVESSWADEFNFEVSFLRHDQKQPADWGWYKWMKDKKISQLLFDERVIVGTLYGILKDPREKSQYPFHDYYLIPRNEFFPHEFIIVGKTERKDTPEGSQYWRFSWSPNIKKDNSTLLAMCFFTPRRLKQGITIDFKPFNRKKNSDRMQILVIQGYWQRDRQRLYSFDFRDSKPQKYTDFYQFYNHPDTGDYIFIREDGLIVDHNAPDNAETPTRYKEQDRFEYGAIIINMLDFNSKEIDVFARGLEEN